MGRMTEVRFRDFSRAPREIGFSADGEEYQVRSAIPPETLQEMAALMKAVRDDPLGSLDAIMRIALEDESAERMCARLRKGHPNPLDIVQAGEICTWMVEQFAQRPTGPSASSSDGSATGGDGTTSTDGQPVAA